MIVETIYTHARRTPDRTAIVYNNNRLTYRQFARLIEGSRRHLAGLGLPGEGIAVLPIASVMDAWVHGLALRCLGLTTVVVRSPDEISRLGLKDVRCVLTMDDGPEIALGRLLPGWRIVRMPRSVHAEALMGSALPMPELPVRSGGHIQLTSGTTGSYKKVLIDQDGEATLMRQRQKAFRISKRTVFALCDFGGWTMIGYQTAVTVWDAGGCVVLYEGPDRSRVFAHDGITDAVVVPRMLMALVAATGAALRRDDRMTLYVTGGPLPLALAQEAKARLTSRIYTYLGSTEASGFALTRFTLPEDLRWHSIIGSREVQVVDETGVPVPAGQVGRVRVRTVANVSAYLDDEATSREFFRDGFFYTGDLGVIRPDGRLALYGRVTDVVNVLGDKRAAGPIEEALQRQLRVDGVCVFSMPDEAGAEIIHVTIESPQPLPDADVAAGLRKVLPGATRVQIRFVETLPRNTMGKIQRDVLKQTMSVPSIAL